MFVTNKRVKLPNEIFVNIKIVNGKIVETKVRVVSSFKLLGVTIDNKLNFSEHCSNIKRIFNRYFTVSQDFFSYVHPLKYTFLKHSSSPISIIASHS